MSHKDKGFFGPPDYKEWRGEVQMDNGDRYYICDGQFFRYDPATDDWKQVTKGEGKQRKRNHLRLVKSDRREIT